MGNHNGIITFGSSLVMATMLLIIAFRLEPAQQSDCDLIEAMIPDPKEELTND